MKATPLRLPLGHGAGPDEHELEIEQLVEGEPPPAQLRLGGGGGPMDRAERVGQRGQAERAPERLGQHVVRERDERVEMPVDQRRG